MIKFPKILRRTWLFSALSLLMLCAFLPAAMAQTDGVPDNAKKILDALPLEEWQQAADSAGADISIYDEISALISGDMRFDETRAVRYLADIATKSISRAAALFLCLFSPALIASAAMHIAPGSGAQDAVTLACRCGMAVGFFASLGELTADVQALLSTGVKLMDAAVPVMVFLLSLTGASATAQMVTPASTLVGGIVVNVAASWSVKMCMAGASAAVAGSLSEGVKLKKLFSMLRAASNWTLGILMSAFLAVMTLQGRLAASYDSAAVKTAKYAVDNLLPIIGGEVADTMDVLISSVLLVKNAAGVAGMLVLVTVCARPLVSLVMCMLAVKVAGALTESITDKITGEMIDRFGQVLEMLLVAASAGLVLGLILLGSVLLAAKGFA